jgi:hypothetical protein
LDLDAAATIEVTSEDKDFPIEASLSAEQSHGWRAAELGSQTIRLRISWCTNPARNSYKRLLKTCDGSRPRGSATAFSETAVEESSRTSRAGYR